MGETLDTQQRSEKNNVTKEHILNHVSSRECFEPMDFAGAWFLTQKNNKNITGFIVSNPGCSRIPVGAKGPIHTATTDQHLSNTIRELFCT